VAAPIDGIQRFINPNFLIGCPELLSNITRKGNKSAKRFKADLTQKLSAGDLDAHKRIRELECAVRNLVTQCEQYRLENEQLRTTLASTGRLQTNSKAAISCVLPFNRSSDSEEGTESLSGDSDSDDDVILPCIKQETSNCYDGLLPLRNEDTSSLAYANGGTNYSLVDQDDYGFDLLEPSYT
jgi:hypothetical protein